jgi:MoaA/NifB/PqqE/SkfB family radical SAM enzyme
MNALPAPRFLFIETTTECNLRCRQCHMWLTREPETTLRTEEKTALVHQLADWSPAATVVLTGGETMNKREEFFALSRACRQRGLTAAANANETRIDEGVLNRLLTEGPRYLVISLDSHRRELHDWIRGVPGTHDQVVTALRGLIARKHVAYPHSDVRIVTNTIVFDQNVGELNEYVAFARELGVDGIMFQMLSRTFLLASKRDSFFEQHFPREAARVDAAIDGLLELKARGAPILTSENDLRWMKLYARNPDFIGEQVCGSAERNMMVDQHGDVQLCFSMRGLMGGRALGNVRSWGLRELWESTLAAEARQVMAGCRQNCGMLNCHRKEAA